MRTGLGRILDGEIPSSEFSERRFYMNRLVASRPDPNGLKWCEMKCRDESRDREIERNGEMVEQESVCAYLA